jgi:hypothetical protein
VDGIGDEHAETERQPHLPPDRNHENDCNDEHHPVGEVDDRIDTTWFHAYS